MKRRYFLGAPLAPAGFEEVGEDVWYSVIGNEITRPYADKVCRGDIAVEDIPEEYRETVAAIVAARVERYGAFEEDEATEADLYNALAELGVTDDEESNT